MYVAFDVHIFIGNVHCVGCGNTAIYIYIISASQMLIL